MVYIFFIFKKRLPLLQADRTRVVFVVCVYFFQDEKNILSSDCVLKSLIYIFFNLCLTYQHYMNAVYNFFKPTTKNIISRKHVSGLYHKDPVAPTTGNLSLLSALDLEFIS